jgi:hypothetical protein
MEKEVIVDGKVINLEVTRALLRSGTPLANRNLGVSVELSTVEPIAVFWSMTSPTSE